MKRRYRLTKMNKSSARYGNCEICGKHVADVYLQSVEHESSYGGWIQGIRTFGHEECLKSIRKE